MISVCRSPRAGRCWQDIVDYAPATLELATVAFILSLVVGLPLGVLAAVRRDTVIDHVARAVSLIGVSAPTFWLAFIALAVFYGWLNWAPGPGRLDPVSFPPDRITGLLLIDTALQGDWDTFHDAAAHLVLPSIVLAAATLGLITRTTRAAMLEALSQDYVRVAKAKGLRGRLIVVGHALPNAMLPVVTLGGLAYANLLAGAVMTETVFSWPGLGRYTFRSAVTVDFPAIMGITAIVAAIFVSGELPGRHVLRPARSARGEEMSDIVLPGDRLSARPLAAPLRPGGVRRGDHRGLGARGDLRALAHRPTIRTPSTWRRGCGRRRPRTGSAPMRWAAMWSHASSMARACRSPSAWWWCWWAALFGTLLGATAAYARGWAEEGADAR